MNREPSPPVIIAIDGTSGSGKSTVARLLAKLLDYGHVDTGSMYRAITWRVLKEGIDPKDTPQVVTLLKRLRYECEFARDEQGIRRLRNLLDGNDPGLAIRAAEVEKAVSAVSAIPEIRHFLVGKQRELVRFGNLVVEGRDIGTVVFPNTPHKFYLDADPAVRASRRAADPSQIAANAQAKNGAPMQLQDVSRAIAERDKLDSTRAVAPLKMAGDATRVDTSAHDAQGVAELILREIRNRAAQ
ncbi:MAG: (d)CMP kinase [Verrucomicrobiae bacterium]|nr:(d)CMP kinase [Verrucomicrobiae bacterium]